MHDKRLTKRLQVYWDSLRKDSPLPKFERFNGSALADVIGNCCWWSAEISTNSLDKKHRYTFLYMGSSIKEAVGKDMTGEILSSKIANFPATKIVTKMDLVMEQKIPMEDEGQFINDKHKIVKYRSCLLPFGNEDRVTNVLLGLSWSAF